MYRIFCAFLALSMASVSVFGQELKEAKVVGQAFSLMNKQVIYWTESVRGTKSFYFCQDRNNKSTCEKIGPGDYTSEQLAETAVLLKEKSKKSKLNAQISLGIGGALGILSIFLPPGFDLAAGVTAGGIVSGGYSTWGLAKEEKVGAEISGGNVKISEDVDLQMVAIQMRNAFSRVIAKNTTVKATLP